MASSWALALTGSLLFAAKASKIMGAIGVLVVLLFIIYLMIRSLGFNSKTPPKMVLRKLSVVLRSFYAPLFYPRKLNAANELHDAGKLAEALEIYLNVFDFDGLTSSRAEIAIHNDTVLEYIEEICEQTSYDFPSERINRFREDLYDYFLVKTKYLAATDYDQTPLHRPENEDRFKDDLNLSKESELIEGFEHFLTTLCSKIEQHLKQGAQVLPRGTKTSKPKPEAQAQFAADTPATPADPFAASAPAGPFGGTGESAQVDLPPPPADPFGGNANPFGGADEPAEIGSPPDPFASSAPAGDVAAPAGLFGDGQASDADPFSFNDPLDPYHDATGVMHKLPGAAEDPPAAAAPPPPPVGDGTQMTPMPAPPPGLGTSVPQPTGGFPGLGAPNSGIPAPPAPSGFPQPTGAFPGFGDAPAAPQPTGAFPGTAPGGGFPQPTGAFPGFGNQGAPAAPQPTGAFPGMGGAPMTPPLGGGFPQPTGGFPGFQQAPPAAPTGGFPPPAGGGFPGGGAPMTPPAGGGFPQPTGGFPGFQQAPQGLPPNPFGVPEDKKE